MDYEQKYKEALSRARVVNPGTKDYNIVTTIFPELKKSDNERIRENAIQIIRYSMDGIDVALPLSIYKECIAWLEKQGGQEPIDKVESKFKIGDWVVDINFPRSPYKVIEVCESWYETIDVDGFHYSISFKCEAKFRPWTIQDAKNGDVLATKDAVFIFKHLDKTGLSLCKSHCEVIGDSKLGLGFDFSINSVYPATKEQRDLLFQKIHEAGYIWDSNKKELIKYE